MSRWEAALESQVRLLNWWRSPRGEKYALAFAGDVNRKGRQGGRYYAQLPGIESAKLERAEPVYVDENVMNLIEAAATSDSFRPEPIVPEDLFCEEGFALLPRPFLLKDVADKVASFRAFSWGPVVVADAPIPDGIVAEKGRWPGTSAMHITLYSHREDDDSYNPSLNEMLRQWSAETGNSMEMAARMQFGGNLSMFHSAPFPWGEVPDWPDTIPAGEQLPDHLPAEFGERTLDRPLANNWRDLWGFIQTFFRLADQRIIIRDRVHGNRTERKQLARLKPDNDGVLVVRLRRPRTPASHEGREIDWKQQWIVSGHWRRQWYPTLKEHRNIWISDYVKGPEDKPLVLHSGRAFEFVR